jgi:hypothetical protein
MFHSISEFFTNATYQASISLEFVRCLPFIVIEFSAITASDFLNRSAAVNADPISVDVTHPIITENSITIKGRHLTNSSEIKAW